MTDIIQIQDREIVVHEGWNDISLQKLMQCYLALMGDYETYLAAEEIPWVTRIAIFRILCDIDDDFTKSWRQERIQLFEDGANVFAAELRTMTKTATKNLFEETEKDGNTEVRLKLNLTKCPYPVLDMKEFKGDPNEFWYAPADGLSNLTFYELGMTFQAFEDYIQTNDVQHADRLLAILYRPGKPQTEHNLLSNYEGDRRLPLQKHESTIPDRQKKLAKLPEYIKQFLMFWYASCRQEIVQAYPKVFRPSNGDTQTEGYGWGGLILQLSENLAHVDLVAAQHYSNALTKLSMLEDDRIRMEVERTKRAV